MAMAVAAGCGPVLIRSHYCRDMIASSSLCFDGVVASGQSAGVRTSSTTIARIGRRRSSRFGCSASDSEVESSSYSTSGRMQRMTITRSSRRGSSSNSSSTHRGSGRQEALRSRRQLDVVVGDADADAIREEDQALGSFWDRLQLAWRVLIGAPSEAQATRKRFSRLLVRDRGFNSTNLSRLYNAAKGAIEEHVELEGDEDTEVAAVVDRLGELRLDFRVKRVKSVLRDEPFSDHVLPEMEPSMSISGDQLWEDSSRASHNSEFRVGVALNERLPNSNLPGAKPKMSISGDQLWEYSRERLDLKARLGLALDRPSPNTVTPDGERPVSTSGGQLWEDNRASHDNEVARGASNLKSTTVEEASDGTFPKPVLPIEEPNLSISGDQLWKDDRASHLEDQVRGSSELKSSALGGALNKHSSDCILPDVKPFMSINGGRLLDESRVSQDLEDQVGRSSNLKSSDVGGDLNEHSSDSILPDVEPFMPNNGGRLLDQSRAARDLAVHIEEDSYVLSTTNVDSKGWYTFSFTNAKVGQRIGATTVDGDSDTQL
ncbi:unnamed protein product [Calypogeia fissa]